MSAEIQISYQSNKTCYFLIRNRIGQIWNTVDLAFQAYATLDYSEYKVALTQQGTASAFYTGDFPATIVAGVYSIVAKEQISGSPLETDPTIAVGDFQWNGSVTLPLSDLATSGQIGILSPMRIARGTMILNFPFKLVSSVDHITPFTSGVPSGQIRVDGGAFGPLQSGAFTEHGLGHYTLQALTSGDLLGNTAALVISATGVSGGNADQRDFTFILNRSSGQL